MTAFKLYTVYKPFKILEISKTKVIFALRICWVIPLLLSLVPIIFKNKFTQELVISSNIFLSNKFQNRVIIPNELYKLAENIENVWSASNTKVIPSPESIYKVRDLSNWYLNSEIIRSQYPNISIDIKKVFGYYSSSAVCLPDFFSHSSFISKFNLALMSFNFFLVVFISIGYVLIFIKIKSTNSESLSKNKPRKEKTMLIRISLIVATDIICWLPVIVFSFLSFFGYPIPGIVHSFISIIVLPINSLLNPVIYSKLDVYLAVTLKKLYAKL